MENQISNDNPTPTGSDNPQGTASVDTGTVNTNGQAQGDAPVDIFKGVDPAKLPPEVKPYYDSMVKDYREKTARISETVKSEAAKAAEAYKAKADSYEQLIAQEEFVNLWNDYVQKQNGQSPQGDSKLNEVEAKVREISQQLKIAELDKLTTAFAEAMNEKGEKINPDFDKFNSQILGKVKTQQGEEEFSFLRAHIELASGQTPQEKLMNGYKAAKATYDSIYEEGRKAGLGKLQSKVMNASNAPTNIGGGLSTTEKKPKNAQEALDMAKKGLVVSR